MVTQMDCRRGTLPGGERRYQLSAPLPISKFFLKVGIGLCHATFLP